MSALPVETPLATRFLQPGQFVVSVEPMRITTILGSCISVCLWDSRHHIGGMNHFMLPLYTGAGSAASSPRFGNIAMSQLLDQLRALGARLPFLQARVFGGACMFEQMSREGHLGAKNAEVALDFLHRNGIEIAQISTGGNRGRKLNYFTAEGRACLTSI
jgi:chemotaxis protein CheD